MREINGKPIRQRGGRKHTARSFRTLNEPTHDQSSACMATEGTAHRDGTSFTPAFFECAEGVPEDVYPRRSALGHGPRESLTKRQHLQLFAQKVEFEQLKDTKHVQEMITRDKWNGKIRERRLTEVTDPHYRVSWRSDQSLLRRGRPDAWGEGERGTYYKRITSHTKTRQDLREFKTNPENDIQLNGRTNEPQEDLDIAPDKHD